MSSPSNYIFDQTDVDKTMEPLSIEKDKQQCRDNDLLAIGAWAGDAPWQEAEDETDKGSSNPRINLA
jgi:hypothetical protein